MCRPARGSWEFLLVHPGGPYFARKDDGVWSIPKGLVEPSEDPLLAARREFAEELGVATVDTHFAPLGEVQQKSGKRVLAWAFAGSWDPDRLVSNTFECEWPPRSGQRRVFPEVDRAAFFDRDTAYRKLIPEQAPLLERAFAWLAEAPEAAYVELGADRAGS